MIKTDGLAAGKGVLVTDDFDEACRDVKEKLSGASFGDAGTTVVIEEGLEGEECSLTVLFDGEHAYALAPAQDFKRVGDANAGPNTGGMGAYAPMEIMTPGLIDEVMSSIIAPTVGELTQRDIEYRGVLYAGRDADVARVQVARVQRALRRPRDRGDCAALRRRDS